MTEPSTATNVGKKRSRRWLLEAGVVGAAYVGITSFQTSDLLDKGSTAPDFTTTDLEGREVSLHSYADQPLVLHFWASWCGVCRQEFGMLKDFHAARGTKQSRLLTLIAEEPSPKVVDFVKQHALDYPIVYAPPSVVRAYRVSAFPTTYYLTRSHAVSSATIGMSTGLALRLRALLSS